MSEEEEALIPSASSLDQALEIAAAIERVEQLKAEAEEMAAGVDAHGNTTALTVPAGGELSAPAVKAQAALIRSQALRKQTELRQAQEKLKALLESKVRDLNAVVKPLQKMVKQAEELIWTANLYLGRDEEIVTLRDGKPAPAETQLSIRQQVLSMDEECAVAAEQGGIDAMDINKFDAWLLEDPSHLDQVLPESKGVVVLIPRRQTKEYSNPWEQTAMDEANRQSYWLIRNGERLFRMATSFQVGKTLVPTREEFVGFFSTRRFNWETREEEIIPLEPGSSAWLQAEEHADARRRHFMRVALVLQGLIDRTTVFHPLPPGGVSILTSAAYEQGKLRVINDAELLLADGTEPFQDWIRRLNAQLRPGMRIVGNFRGQAFDYANEYGGERGFTDRHSRLSPKRAAHPQTAQFYQIEERRPDGGLVFRYARHEEVWNQRRWEYQRPQRRASCTVYPRDTFFIPIDLVTVAEMRHYLTLRTARHNYIDMLPLLREAIRAKEAEAAAEAPFRLLITGELMKSYGLEHDDAAREVDDLVEWWKLANRWHRPLVDDPEAEGKALRMIRIEAGRRLAASPTDERQDQRALAHFRAAVPDMVALVQRRDGSYLALEAQVPGELVYLKVHRLPRTLRGQHTVSEWVLPASSYRRWRVVWAASDWARWNRDASPANHLTGPELEQVMAEMRAIVEARAADSDERGRRMSSEGLPMAITRPQGTAITRLRSGSHPRSTKSPSSCSPGASPRSTPGAWSLSGAAP